MISKRRKKLVIESDNLEDIEFLWRTKYCFTHDVLRPVHAKWKWRKWTWVHRLVLTEKKNEPSLFDLEFRRRFLNELNNNKDIANGK